MTEFRFSLPQSLAAGVALSIRKAPMPHPDHPDLWSTEAFAWPGSPSDRDAGVVVVRFPDPEPVVPCEVMAWHDRPTVDTKYRLWKFLRDRATVTRCGPRYMMGNTTYTANDDGSITIS